MFEMKKFEHPLTEWLIQKSRSEGEKAFDAVHVMLWLGAPSRPPNAVKAYKAVAGDLLAVAHQNGHLTIDAAGWYYVNKAVLILARKI